MSGELPEPEEPAPAFQAPSDYADEIGSQRRVRWMTQVMVMPALVCGLYGFAYLLGYTIGDSQAHLEREWLPLTLTAAVIAVPSYFMLRGKIGARRRWLNYVILGLCLGVGGGWGWRSGNRDFRAQVSSTFAE